MRTFRKYFMVIISIIKSIFNTAKHEARIDSDESITIPEDLQWFEAPLDINSKENECVLSIVTIDKNHNPHLIGTAFIMSSYGKNAFAISAAHCLEQVRSIINPHATHAPTTPKEFLPPPKEIDISAAHAIYFKNGKVYTCKMKIAYWDNGSDFAILEVLAPEGKNDLFDITLLLDNEIPKPGETVVMIGVGEMSVRKLEGEGSFFEIERRLVGRVGRIEEVNMEKSYLLKSPHVVTSIAICSGMSGGLVAKASKVGDGIKPFALISHAPEPQPYTDPKSSGHSVAAILPINVTPNGDGTNNVEIRFQCVEIGRMSESSR